MQFLPASSTSSTTTGCSFTKLPLSCFYYFFQHVHLFAAPLPSTQSLPLLIILHGCLAPSHQVGSSLNVASSIKPFLTIQPQLSLNFP